MTNPQAYHIANKALSIRPITLRAANDFVKQFHRHHKPERGHKFSVSVVDATGKLVGVAICGRTKAAAWDDGVTLEVTRTCTDGTANANSCLYGACYRIGREMGYTKIITYTQEGESGASLRAVGWEILARRKPRKNWYESSVKLKALRDPSSTTGGVARTVWVKHV